MAFRRLWCLALTLMTTAFCLYAQEPAFQLNISSSLFPLEAYVKDSSGKAVLNLTRDDFEIYEDGNLQKIGYFALSDAPRSMMLIFDRSGSTEPQEPFMLEAINSFSRTLRSSDRIAIFSFAIELEVRQRWLSIGNGKFPVVKMPPTQTWSAVYESIDRAERRFDDEKGRRGIIMLTDGLDSDFFTETKRLGGVLDIAKDDNFQKYLRKLQKRNIPVYFVALPADPRGEFAYLNGAEYQASSDYRSSGLRSPTVGADYVIASRRRIERIAEVTGGRVLAPTRLEEVASFYERIARELGESYSLGYTPENTTEGGKFRRIEVRLRKPGLTVTQTRTGFQP